MRKKKSFFIIASVCFGALFAFNMAYSFVAAPTAVITLRNVSPNDVDADATLTVSSGLPNVGVGEKIYLLANEAASYSWTVSEQPTGSTAALSSSSTQNPTFTPDVEGQYKITLVVTTSEGSSDPAELWISAGTFVGAGTESTTQNPGYCAAGCHFTKVNDWQETLHATMFERHIDEGYYTDHCISCHTVGYNTDANNGGFDDVAAAAGWTFPSAIQAGNWASMVADYPDVANLANIQCENCHGPGSQHNTGGLGLHDKNQIAQSFEQGACLSCHEAEPYHLHAQQWANSKHASNTSYPSGESRASCVACHTGAGFITTYDSDYAAVNTSYSNINCQTCHDPHAKDNDHQIRRLENVTLNNGEIITDGGYGKICMNCHLSRRDVETYVTEYHSHFGPHYGPQTDMLAGTNFVEYGLDMGNSPHLTVVENACVSCHMPAYDSHSGLDPIKSDFDDTGMSDEMAETLRDNVYGHSFWPSYTDEATGTEYDNVTPCEGCHGELSSFDGVKADLDHDGDGVVEGVQSEVKGLLTQLAMLLPPYNEDAVSVTSSYSSSELKAAFNYLAVYQDGSFGVHNAAYAFGLLKASIASLTTGDIGAGQIISVSDVSNDQGKQVLVKWMRFPGDGTGDPKIVKYGVWRKEEAAMAKTSDGSAVKVADLEEMFSNISTAQGLRFKVADGEVWEFLREVPAAAMEYYSAVVPTLFDSTITNGQHLSYFIVSGHGSNDIVVKSESVSGYSVDNLAPEAPVSLAFSFENGNVVLKWSDPVDEDFKFFAIHRSASAGFTPGENTLAGTSVSSIFEDTEISAGGTFYYKVTAYDFSGNQGAFSAELAVAVTSVNDGGLAPDKYGLAQNYPNPFNPQTIIGYQLPASSSVKLTIYNVLGQEIRTLVNTVESAGYKSIIWDGRDNSGRVVTPGVYIYKLQAGNFTAIRKMILLK